MAPLRPEFLPPALDEAFVRRLTLLADQIVDQIDARGDSRPLVMKFNVLAGTDLTPADFMAAEGSTGMRQFVQHALTPRPGPLPDVTYDQLLDLVTRVLERQGSESDIQFWIDLLQANLPNRSVANLINWPFGCPEPPGVPEATPKQVLDAALAGRDVVTPEESAATDNDAPAPERPPRSRASPQTAPRPPSTTK